MRLYDNSRQDRSVVDARIPQLAKKLSNKTLAQLEKEDIFVFPEGVQNAEDLTGDQMVLQSVNDTYYTGNVMGFLGCGKERLVIASRFSAGNQDYFLQYMMDKVLACPNVFEMETDSNENNQLINILMFLFPAHLKTAMRKGLFKNYIHEKYNDPNPKGNINIARHIRQNTPFMGKIAYDQREQSYDNHITELIRHTIEFIKTKPNGNLILNRAKDEVDRIVEATPRYKLQDQQKVLHENKKHIIRHAFFREYRALQRLCVLILQHQKQELGSGITRVYGVLFDGAWLWEEYVASLVSDRFHHPMNKAGKAAQHLFFDGNRNKGRIYPDFIGKNEKERIIADAKYKPIGNIGNQDYFQVLAYMFRFDAKKGLYFYPETGSAESLCLLLNQGTTLDKSGETARGDIRLIKHGLKIPQNAENYLDFCEKIKISETAFKRMVL